MKKKENEVRKTYLKIRVNKMEVDQMKTFQKKTTERSLSNYLRKLGLHQPVMVTYRNKSADDFLREMVEHKKQLNALGNNLNQAVKKLHMLEKIPEFRLWLQTNEPLLHALNNKVEEIRLRINQLYEQWLRK